MIARVVSGGQTGVYRAALDAAMELSVPVGGRRAEDGRIPDRYPVTETPDGGYPARTRWNVCDSDFTPVLTEGEPAGGTLLTAQASLGPGRPHAVVGMNDQRRLDAEIGRGLVGHSGAPVPPGPNRRRVGLRVAQRARRRAGLSWCSMLDPFPIAPTVRTPIGRLLHSIS
jgi:putative molybdenum carrier protein